MPLSSKRIMLTGGAGFLGLGSFVTEKLQARNCTQILIPKEQDYDLTKSSAIEAAFKAAGNLFSTVPNPIPISLRTPRPPRLSGELPSPSSVDIVIHLAYPFAPIPFKEEDLWNGYPEETNAPYGLAKKMLPVQSQAYRQPAVC